ncbi:MAG: methyltransferase [Paracoccaceae bacterium]
MTFHEPAPRALRLELALDAGLSLPESGAVAIFHPRAGERFDAIDPARIRIITPHAPDHAHFSAQRLPCARPAGERYAAAVVCVPRGRIEARDLVAQACTVTDGPVIIDGQKTDGVEALLRDLRTIAPMGDAISKGHGKIAWMDAPHPDLGDWRAEPALADGYTTLPGIFSSDGIDKGSALLAEALAAGGFKGVAVDLGAGWGFLSQRLLALAPDLRALHLVESDARALDCARANVTDTRAQFLWADATQPLTLPPADLVIMNPPFHNGRDARPQLGAAFIRTAANLLKPTGALWMVANRHLPYDPVLAGLFRESAEVAGNTGFKVLVGRGPIRQKTPTPAPGKTRTRTAQTRGRRA